MSNQGNEDQSQETDKPLSESTNFKDENKPNDKVTLSMKSTSNNGNFIFFIFNHD